MITTAFEFMADVRETLSAELTASNAKRDFYLAQADLTAAIYGGAGGGGGGGGAEGASLAAGGDSPH